MPGKFKFNKRPDSKVQKQQPVEQPKEFADAEEVEEARKQVSLLYRNQFRLD